MSLDVKELHKGTPVNLFPSDVWQIEQVPNDVFASVSANAKSSAGLLEMPDIRSAMEALIITNHYTINPPGTASPPLRHCGLLPYPPPVKSPCL